MNPKDRMAAMMMPPSGQSERMKRAMAKTRSEQYTDAGVQTGDMTPAEAQSYMASDRATGKVVSEVTGIGQAMRAGGAIKEAAQNPSVPSFTNAGVQSSLAFLKPLLAAKVFAGGLGVSALQQVGATDISANAAGLTDEQKARMKQLQTRIGKGDWKSGAERREVEAELKGIRDIESANNLSEVKKKEAADLAAIEADKALKLKKTDEDGRAVVRAENARDTELRKDKSFADTPIGETWGKVGGVAPFLAGLGLGGVSRMASGGGSVMKNYGIPVASGALAGATSANIPLASDAFFTPVENPQRRAYEAYARELPPDHPRRAEWQSYARGLPLENPTRAAASKELYDPLKAAERMAFGALEGAGGGLFGGELVRIPGRLAGKAKDGAVGTAEAVGDVGAAWQQSQGRIATAKADVQALRRNSSEAQQNASEAQLSALRAQSDVLRERQVLAEAERASSQQMGGRASAPAPQTRPEPALPPQSQPAVPSNDLVPLPPVGGANLPVPAAQGGYDAGIKASIDNGFAGIGKILRDLANRPSAPPVVVQPPAPAAKQSMIGARHNPNWPPYSPQARAQLDSMLGQGRTFGNTGRGQDIRASEILDSLDNASFGVQNVQDRMRQLRDVLFKEKGIDPKTMTQDQWRAVEKSIDPRIFAAPVIAGGAALSAKDIMTLQMMGEY